MGFNTTVMILNDGFDQIERNPEEFVKQIAHTMNRGGTVGVGNHGNCVQVMRTEHADVPRLYASKGNFMVELSPYSKDTIELMERNADLLRQYIEDARWLLNGLERQLGKAGP